MKNLAFHSLLRWKMIIQPILTTSLIHSLWKGGRIYFLNLGVKGRVKKKPAEDACSQSAILFSLFLASARYYVRRFHEIQSTDRPNRFANESAGELPFHNFSIVSHSRVADKQTPCTVVAWQWPFQEAGKCGGLGRGWKPVPGPTRVIRAPCLFQKPLVDNDVAWNYSVSWMFFIPRDRCCSKNIISQTFVRAKSTQWSLSWEYWTVLAASNKHTSEWENSADRILEWQQQVHRELKHQGGRQKEHVNMWNWHDLGDVVTAFTCDLKCFIFRLLWARNFGASVLAGVMRRNANCVESHLCWRVDQNKRISRDAHGTLDHGWIPVIFNLNDGNTNIRTQF